MTTNSRDPFVPLVIRRAERLMNRDVRSGRLCGSEDPLPMIVQRRHDGAIVSRDSSLTEVRTETTDDN